MTSNKLLASLVAASGFCLAAAACSSKSSSDGNTAGAGGGTSGGAGTAGTSGSAGSGGTAGGASGSAGDSAGSSGSAGSSSGSAGAAGSAGDTSAGGASGSSSTAGAAGNAGTGNAGSAGTGQTCQANTMTDPENCGACGHSCGGGDCDAGQCLPVVVMDTSGRNIQRQVSYDDPGSLGFVSQGNFYLWNYGYTLPSGDFDYEIAKTSVVPTTPAADGNPPVATWPADPSNAVEATTTDSGYVYYTLPLSVFRKKIDTTDGTGAGTKVFSLDTGRVWSNIAIAGNVAYLTGTVDTNMVDLIKTGIYSIPLPVANAASKPVAITGLTNLDERISDLTVVGGHLFWLEYDEATTHSLLWTAPIAGGTPVNLDDVIGIQSSIAGDPNGTYVYWTRGASDGAVKRCPIANLDTGHVEPIADSNNSIEGIVVDDNFVYFAESVTLVTGKPVYRAAKDGSGREYLGEWPGIFHINAVDAGFVYFMDFDNIVYRLSKTPSP